MTIDEAIVKYNKLANNDRTCHPEEAQQLAEWLEELKAYKSDDFTKNLQTLVYKQGYNKAIDDFVKEICKMIVQSENNGNYRFYAVEIKQAIADLAEQLKAGGENEQSKMF